jgi:hypothetical protein
MVDILDFRKEDRGEESAHHFTDRRQLSMGK